ncbi:MAG: amidase [Aureispira sp.]
MSSSICSWSAAILAQKIRQQEITIVAVMQAYLAQITAFNPSINALTHLRSSKELLAEAQAKDQQLQTGAALGQLFGVPIAIKASFLTKGLRVSNGDPLLRHYVAEEDAPLVQHLKAAGAIIIGTTNLPLFSIDWQSTNFWDGQTNNPYDLTRVVGGSSGGSAAAVAAQFSPLAIGSDAGGSIRVPAHFCGICGLRPTEHLLSNKGHLKTPNRPQGRPQIAVPGPFARTVEDLLLMMRVLLKSQDSPGGIAPSLIFERSQWTEKSLSIAVATSINDAPVEQEYLDIFKRFVTQLEQAGHQIHYDNPAYEEATAYRVAGHIQGFEIGGVNSPNFPFSNWLIYAFLLLKYRDHPWASSMTKGLRLSARQYAEALDFKEAFSAHYHQFLSQYDLWLTPVCGLAAFKHQRAGIPFSINGQKVPYTKAIASFNFNTALSGHPIAVIPIGHTANGLPVGVQLHAKHWEDKRLLEIAQSFEHLTAPYLATPFSSFEPA